MGQVLKEALKQKTTWAGLAAVITGVGMLVTGEDKTASIMAILNGLGLIFLRQAVAKGGNSQ